MSLRAWLSVRHPLRVELLTVLGLYAVYESSRGLVSTHDGAVAVRHADDIVALERALHMFVERNAQEVAERVGGLVGLLGVAYLTLHLTATGVLLLWLHRRRPHAYAFVRTTLLLASEMALIGFIVFPTAPPRLSGVGILDTLSSNSNFDLNHGLVSSLYKPYAAMPSMHAGYATVVGVTVFRETRPLLLRLVGLAYPIFVVLVIVSTGNHFFLDAIAGVIVVGLAAGITRLLVDPIRERDFQADVYQLVQAVRP